MSPAAEPSLIVVAIPAFIFVAVAAAILAWPRPLLDWQIRMQERQIQWMKGQSAVVLTRILGGFLLLAGLGIFFIAAMAPK